jgi:hypothetical protein
VTGLYLLGTTDYSPTLGRTTQGNDPLSPPTIAEQEPAKPVPATPLFDPNVSVDEVRRKGTGSELPKGAWAPFSPETEEILSEAFSEWVKYHTETLPGGPEGWVEYAPLVGSGWDCGASIADGRYSRALTQGGLCLLDIVGAGAVLKGGVKYGVKRLLKGAARESDDVLKGTVLRPSNRGWGFFKKAFGQAPPPSGPESEALRQMMLNAANSRLFRFRANVWACLTRRGPIDWERFMTKLSDASFREFKSLKQGAGSLGGFWVCQNNPDRWLFGVPKYIRNLPFFGKSTMRHEVFHALQDFKYGLSKMPETTMKFTTFLKVEEAAHFFGGPVAGLVPNTLAAGVIGGAGTGLGFLIYWGIVIFS